MIIWAPHDSDARALSEKGVEVCTPHPSGVFVTNMGRVFFYHEGKDRYREVKLTKSGARGSLRAGISRTKRPLVQVLVLEAFEGKGAGRVRRWNTDKTDNRLCNLYWAKRCSCCGKIEALP